MSSAADLLEDLVFANLLLVAVTAISWNPNRPAGAGWLRRYRNEIEARSKFLKEAADAENDHRAISDEERRAHPTYDS